MSQQSRDARREVRTLIKKRGRRKYNVWTGYASKGGFKFALDGTPKTLHLIWMEGDPDVLEYRIPSDRIVGRRNEELQVTIPDAICIMRSRDIEWREVRGDSGSEELCRKSSDQIMAQVSSVDVSSAKLRLITTTELAQHATLIKNWRRGLAYMWAASEFDLNPYAYAIRAILRRDKAMSLGQILKAYPPEDEALLIAAVFQMSQKREINTDLIEKPFGFDTIIRVS